jgi:uncharacterized membrane protein
MVEWDAVIKVFFISILGTFFAMGMLTLIIKLLGIIFAYYGDNNGSQE